MDLTKKHLIFRRLLKFSSTLLYFILIYLEAELPIANISKAYNVECLYNKIWKHDFVLHIFPASNNYRLKEKKRNFC